MPPTASALKERLFAEASQYSEKANVVDFVADRARFIATAIVTLPGETVDRRGSKLLEAARSLREALMALRPREDVVVPLWRLLENGRRLIPPLPSRLSEMIRGLQRGRDQDRERMPAPARDLDLER